MTESTIPDFFHATTHAKIFYFLQKLPNIRDIFQINPLERNNQEKSRHLFQQPEIRYHWSGAVISAEHFIDFDRSQGAQCRRIRILAVVHFLWRVYDICPFRRR